MKPSKYCPTELEFGDTPLAPELPLTRDIELKSFVELEILYQLSSDTQREPIDNDSGLTQSVLRVSFDAFEPEPGEYVGVLDGVELVTNLGIMGPDCIDAILNVLAAPSAEPPTIAPPPLDKSVECSEL